MGTRSLRVAIATLLAICLTQLPACGRSVLYVEGDAGAGGAAGPGAPSEGGANVDSGLGPPGQCGPTQTTCDGLCVDTQTDQSNCGGCGLSCPQACNAGECVVTVASNQWPVFLAVDQTRVGWINGFGSSSQPDDGYAMTAPKTGGMLTRLGFLQQMASPAPITNIAMTNTDAYCAGAQGPDAEPIAGGPVTHFSGGPGWPTQPYVYVTVAVDEQNIYWGALGDLAVMQMPLSGGTPVMLAHHAASGIALDATSVYLITTVGLVKVPIGGGTIVTLAPNVLVGSLAVSSAGVFVAQGTGIYRVPLDGGAFETVVPDTNTCDGSPDLCNEPIVPMQTVAADATHVYWTSAPFGQSVVRKVPVGGGTPVTLSSGGNYGPIVVDDASVYWGDDAAGAVVRMTPK